MSEDEPVDEYAETMNTLTDCEEHGAIVMGCGVKVFEALRKVGCPLCLKGSQLDTVRLDWLDEQDGDVVDWGQCGFKWSVSGVGFNEAFQSDHLRHAIDAAMVGCTDKKPGKFGEPWKSTTNVFGDPIVACLSDGKIKLACAGSQGSRDTDKLDHLTACVNAFHEAGMKPEDLPRLLDAARSVCMANALGFATPIGFLHRALDAIEKEPEEPES